MVNASEAWMDGVLLRPGEWTATQARQLLILVLITA